MLTHCWLKESQFERSKDLKQGSMQTKQETNEGLHVVKHLLGVFLITDSVCSLSCLITLNCPLSHQIKATY